MKNDTPDFRSSRYLLSWGSTQWHRKTGLARNPNNILRLLRRRRYAGRRGKKKRNVCTFIIHTLSRLPLPFLVYFPFFSLTKITEQSRNEQFYFNSYSFPKVTGGFFSRKNAYRAPHNAFATVRTFSLVHTTFNTVSEFTIRFYYPPLYPQFAITRHYYTFNLSRSFRFDYFISLSLFFHILYKRFH